MARQGYDVDPADLPPHHRVFWPARSGSSSEIRERALKRLPLDGLVTPRVAAYVERYNLYRGAMPIRTTRLRLSNPKVLLVPDDGNDKAKKLAEAFAPFAAADSHDVIVAIGGDGHMLRVIREHWRKRLPFVGINAGHRGYLLNDPAQVRIPEILIEDLVVHQLPLLNVRYQPVHARGQHLEDYAFNDSWVAATDQTAWMEVKVDGRVWFEKLVGDGLLVSTAAGSTGYAANMGAMPLRLDAEEILMVGNNVSRHHHWRYAPLPIGAAVEVRPIDLKKRPIKCRFDDKDVGEVFSVRFRTSRIAAVELAFSPSCDLSAKRMADFMPGAS
jgi:NAD kinase